MILVADEAITMDGPPLKPAFVEVENGLIQSISSTPPSSSQEILSLSGMTLMPGFVNAHTHLEFAAPLFPEKKDPIDFTSWVEKMIASPPSFPHDGITSQLAGGVSCIGNHMGMETPWKEITSSPLCGRLFFERVGFDSSRLKKQEDAYQFLKNELKNHSGSFSFNATPHSVHALPPPLLKDWNSQPNELYSIHLAESEAETLYFKENAGPLFDFLKQRGLKSPHSAESALSFLKKSAFPLKQVLVVHGNVLTSHDLHIIQEEGLSLIHCAGSHDYFGHPDFPLASFLQRGINVAFGTDSRASNRHFNFLDELRLLREKHPTISEEIILRQATLGGAKALKLQGSIGSLSVGKRADILGFRKSPFESSQPDFMMVAGKKII